MISIMGIIIILGFLSTLKTWLKVSEFKNISVFNIGNDYKIGERVGQLVIIPYPQIEFEEVDELSDSERGSGGYGSTGV